MDQPTQELHLDDRIRQLHGQAKALKAEKDRAEGKDLRETLHDLLGVTEANGLSQIDRSDFIGNSLEDALRGAPDPRKFHHHPTSRAKVLEPFRNFGRGDWGNEGRASRSQSRHPQASNWLELVRAR